MRCVCPFLPREVAVIRGKTRYYAHLCLFADDHIRPSSQSRVEATADNHPAMNAPEIYDFRIDAWKPETLPMGRLASYLSKLADLFGHGEHVHFAKVRRGSAIQEIHVDHTSAVQVFERLQLVASGTAPADATRAQRDLNEFLREDNASGMLRIKGGAKILPFPGCKTPLAQAVVIHEPGELIGVVSRVGGRDASVPVLLLGDSGEPYNCNTGRAIAKELAQHLFGEPVRVAGSGKWRRNDQREWELQDFKIKSWEPLAQASLQDAVAELRAVKGSAWNALDDPQAALREMRKG